MLHFILKFFQYVLQKGFFSVNLILFILVQNLFLLIKKISLLQDIKNNTFYASYYNKYYFTKHLYKSFFNSLAEKDYNFGP